MYMYPSRFPLCYSGAMSVAESSTQRGTVKCRIIATVEGRRGTGGGWRGKGRQSHTYWAVSSVLDVRSLAVHRY